MKTMTVNEIRDQFLSYFESQGHTLVPSSSLIPSNDPTLLFVNSGMVQFKDVFLGQDKRSYSRATTVQRCLRAGGKHNDLENVGYTARHHTFFEMLGNFSFGDYFKREAIAFAWQFLTEVLKLPQEKLWITVYREDQEAEAIWKEDMKIDPARFSRCGEKDNFWAMGDTGPCGPCTEIFYDHGPGVAGGPPGSPEEDGDRYIEIWNLVFMQYNRTADGKLHPLPKPSVDTGMGFERLAAVVQGVHNNYDIDLFQALIAALDRLLPKAQPSEEAIKSKRVIVDHIRACSFLICDGIRPSNEGRGYVLRRIMRRAIRHGHKLGMTQPFFHLLVKPLSDQMGGAYPELRTNLKTIEDTLLREEQQFERTLEQGMAVLNEAITQMKTDTLSGDVIFKLYDTYGFPVDLTNDIAREKKLHLDIAGFEKHMSAQRERSQSAGQFGVDYNKALLIDTVTTFTGHDCLDDTGTITAIYVDGSSVDTLKAGEHGLLILDKTSFYAEAGGQVGDKGGIQHKTANFTVEDTTKQGKAYVHHGILTKGMLKVGDTVETHVNKALREATVLNHSGTHLLHAALRHILGPHVVQKGSLVAPDRLRFDFAHHAPLTRAEIIAIENLVNEKIRENAPSTLTLMDTQTALKSGAMALFGEKYDDKVRVLEMAGGFSKELCGGTHVHDAGQVGFFKILSEAGIAAGIRRIEAATGQMALDYVQDLEHDWAKLEALLKTSRDAVIDKVAQTLDKTRTLEREKQALTQQLMSGSSQGTADIREIGNMKVLSLLMTQGDAKALREAMDQWKQKLQSGVVVLALVQEDKVSFVVGVTKDCVDRVHADDLSRHLAEQLGGRAGGRPDMAQGGGQNVPHLERIMNDVYAWVDKQLV